MTVSAVRPWRNAFRLERSLPSGVVGPVLLSALRRLAAICRRELIENHSEELASFRQLEEPELRWGSSLLLSVVALFTSVANPSEADSWNLLREGVRFPP